MLTGLNDKTFADVNHFYHTKDVSHRQITSRINGADNQTLKALFDDIPFVWKEPDTAINQKKNGIEAVNDCRC